MSEIYTKVVEILKSQKSDLDVASVKPESNLIEDLGFDSLDTVEVVMALEEAYGIEVADADAEKLKTIADIVTYIEAHKK